MKAYEVSKGEADIPRGRVMMAIEGTEAWPPTNCTSKPTNPARLTSGHHQEHTP